LGVIEEKLELTGPIYHSDDDFDVFEQTSSDNSGYASHSDGESLTCPGELTTEGHALGTVVSDICGLSDVYPASKYPDARIDAYLFTPCGFSANGVVPAAPAPANSKIAHYFTVHVTPEPHCSYASFETNVPPHQSGRETADIVDHVVKIFKPGRFSATLFEAKRAAEDGSAKKRNTRMDAIEGYRRVDRIVHDLEDYDLVFRYYERLGWKGGAPRIGETVF
jgi:S-adenosylmethionine decarboxylase